MRALVIRADAGAQMGAGHVMRCLALAQAWRARGGSVTLVTANPPPSLAARLTAEGVNVVEMACPIGTPQDAGFTIQTARQRDARWVIVDGYHFDAAYQQNIKRACLSWLWLDDNGDAAHYYADLVLNQNLHADAAGYANREPYTRLLLGPRYTLLRREFLEWRDRARQTPVVARRILVTLGGGDPGNVTGRALDALEMITTDRLEIHVALGAANPHAQAIRAQASGSRHAVRVAENVSEMPAWMAWADLAISGGGSTNWELAYMGLPNLLLALAENQVPLGHELERRGISVNLGWAHTVARAQIAQSVAALRGDPDRRAAMTKRGQALIDGQGAARVIQAMTAAI